MAESEKILLHVCCAPCATACIERLLENNRQAVLFFSNSNIDTPEEFEKIIEEKVEEFKKNKGAGGRGRR